MTYLEFIVTITIGYILGRIPHTTKEREIAESIIQGARHALKRHLPHKVGAVQTPSQQDIIDKEHPEIKEEKEAMREVFKGVENDQRRI